MENENNENLLTIYDNGKEILCEILFTHHCDETNKDYVAVIPLDNQDNESEEDMVYFFSYTVDENEEGQLDELESEEEFQMLSELLDEYMESLDDAEEEDAEEK